MLSLSPLFFLSFSIHCRDVKRTQSIENSRFIPAIFQMQIAETAQREAVLVAGLNWMRGVTGRLVQERLHFHSSNAFIWFDILITCPPCFEYVESIRSLFSDTDRRTEGM